MIKSKKLINKYRSLLAIYISLSIIIIMFVFSIVLACVYRISKDNVMQINSLSAKMLKKEIDNQISAMNNIYQGIVNDYDIFSAINDDGPYERYKLTKKFNTFSLINQNLLDLVLLNYENNTAYSSFGGTTIDEYLRFYIKSNYSSDKINKFVNSIDGSKLCGFYDIKMYNYDYKKSTALYVISISEKRKLVFLIPKEVFTMPVENLMKCFNGSLIVLSPQNEQLLKVNINNGIDVESIPSDIKMKQVYDINVGSYDNKYIITTNSQTSPYKYCVISDSKIFMRKLNTLRLLFGVSTIIIIMIGFIISWVFSGAAYKPFKKLKLSITNNEKDCDNEFQLIINHFQQLQTKLNTVQSNLKLNSEYLYENLINGLLNTNSFYDHNKTIYNKNGITFNFTYIRIVSIDTQTKDIPLIISILESNNNDIKIYPSTKNEYGIFVVIFNYDNEAIFNDILNTVKNKLDNENIKYSIGISDECNSITKISCKFSQSLTALSCCDLSKDIKICYYKQQKEQYKMNVDQFDEIKIRLIDSIKSCDVDSVKLLLNQVFDLSDNSTFINFAYSNLISQLWIIAHSVGYKNDNVNNLIYTADKCKDIKEKMYMEVVKDVCAVIKESKKIVEDKLINEINYFIKKNYSCHDLSVEYVANHFNVSVSYLNKYVKKVSETTVFSMIDCERMEQAKKMITDTNLSIKEISELCGYTDTNYFIKKLKKITGLTPTKYREYCKSL